MKGTEKIIAHIQADARTQADELLMFAAVRTDDLTRSYREKAQAAGQEIIDKDLKESEERVESMSRIAQMEAKRKVLAMKQDLVGQCFDRAAQLIRSLPAEEYKAFLVKLAVESSVTGDEEIILSAADKEAYGADIAAAVNAQTGGHLTISDRTGDFSGGLKLHRGNIEVNSTLEQLIGVCRDEMAPEIVKALFG